MEEAEDEEEEGVRLVVSDVGHYSSSREGGRRPGDKHNNRVL